MFIAKYRSSLAEWLAYRNMLGAMLGRLTVALVNSVSYVPSTVVVLDYCHSADCTAGEAAVAVVALAGSDETRPNCDATTI